MFPFYNCIIQFLSNIDYTTLYNSLFDLDLETIGLFFKAKVFVTRIGGLNMSKIYPSLAGNFGEIIQIKVPTYSEHPDHV